MVTRAEYTGASKKQQEGEQWPLFTRSSKAHLLSVVPSWFVVLVEIDARDAHFPYIYCKSRKNE